MSNEKEYEKIIETVTDITWPARSDKIGQLFGALADAQAEYKTPLVNASVETLKDGHRSSYSYADYDSLWAAAAPALNKHKLSVVQQVVRNSVGDKILITTLGHESGEYTESRFILPEPVDAAFYWEEYGKGLTFARRNSFAALVGIVAPMEDNDAQEELLEESPPASSFPSRTGSPTISQDQYEQLIREIADDDSIGEELCKGFKIKSLKQIPKAQYSNAINYVLRVKDR